MSNKPSQIKHRHSLWWLLATVIIVGVLLRIFVLGSYYVEVSSVVEPRSLILVSYLSKPTNPGDLALIRVNSNASDQTAPALVRRFQNAKVPIYTVSLDHQNDIEVDGERVLGKIVLVLPVLSK